MQQYIIKQLKVALELIEKVGEEAALAASLQRHFHKTLSQAEIAKLQYQFLKRSLDLRKKVEAAFVYKLAILNVTDFAPTKIDLLLKKQLLFIETADYTWAQVKERLERLRTAAAEYYRGDRPRPVIVGFGPAGIYAALVLAAAGLKPLVIERGKAVEERLLDFEKLRSEGILDPDSNAQFGEGGAGCFSDGKLGTRIKDGLLGLVLDILVAHGADPAILWRQNPHIGTDKLRSLLRTVRTSIVDMGGEIHFNSKLTDLEIVNDELKAIVVVRKKVEAQGTYREVTERIPCSHLILAPGHSARDLYKLLHAKRQQLSAKPFAVGFRIEQSQAAVDRIQYGKKYEKLLRAMIGAAEYHLACKVEVEDKERRVYTFCMCPGGEVIASASSPGALCVNGMSYQARAGANANAAVICAVNAEDLGSDLFAGMNFQEYIEQRAYALTRSYAAPRSRVVDFVETVLDKKQREELFKYTDYSENLEVIKSDSELASWCSQAIVSSYQPQSQDTDLGSLYPHFISEALAKGILQLNKQMPCFAPKQAYLLAPETRTSAPLRIERDKVSFMALNCYGLYPCGEGAGYAGGISSAAVDGIKTAKALISSLLQIPLADDFSQLQGL